MEGRAQYIVSSGYKFSEPNEVVDQFMSLPNRVELECKYSNNRFIIDCRKDDGPAIFQEFLKHITAYIAKSRAETCDVFDTAKVVPRPNTQIEEDLGDLDVEAPGAVFLPVNETMDKKEESLLIVHETITKTWRTDRSTDPLNSVFSAEVLREIARTTNSRVEIEEGRIVIRGDDEVNVDKAIQKLNVVDAVAAGRIAEKWENDIYIHEGEINYMLRLAPLERFTDRKVYMIASRQQVRLCEIIMLKWHNPIEGFQTDSRKSKPNESLSQVCRLWAPRFYEPIGPERNSPTNWNSDAAAMAARLEEAKAHPHLPVEKVLGIKEWNLRALAISDPFSAPGTDLEATQAIQPGSLQLPDPLATKPAANQEPTQAKTYKKTKRVIKSHNVESGGVEANQTSLPLNVAAKGMTEDLLDMAVNEVSRPTVMNVSRPAAGSLLPTLEIIPPPIDEPYMPAVNENMSPTPSEAEPDEDLPSWSNVLVPPPREEDFLTSDGRRATFAADIVSVNRGPKTYASALNPKVVVDKALRDVTGKTAMPVWTARQGENLAENKKTDKQGFPSRPKNTGWPKNNKKAKAVEDSHHCQPVQSNQSQNASPIPVAGPSKYNPLRPRLTVGTPKQNAQSQSPINGSANIVKIVHPKKHLESPVEKRQNTSEFDTRQYRRGTNLKASALKPQNDVPTTAITKIMDSTTAILELSTSVKGQITFEVELGKFYVDCKHLPPEYRDPGFKANEWKNIFRPGGGDEPNLTIFSNLLTTSWIDAECILDLHLKSNQRLFNEDILEQSVTYEFNCRFIQTDTEMILELNEDKSFNVRRPGEIIGANHWHFVKRKWDARLAVTAHSEADKEFKDTLRDLVDHIYVPAGQDLPCISTWSKDVQIDAVLVKRRTSHRCYKHPDVVLQLTEIQDLMIEQPLHRHYRAYGNPAARMENDGNRLWWEVSLTSHTAQEMLLANQWLEVGEYANWTPQDFVEQGIIKDLYDVTSEVVTRIDAVGCGTRSLFTVEDNSIGLRSGVAVSKREMVWGPNKKRNYW